MSITEQKNKKAKPNFLLKTFAQIAALVAFAIAFSTSGFGASMSFEDKPPKGFAHCYSKVYVVNELTIRYREHRENVAGTIGHGHLEFWSNDAKTSQTKIWVSPNLTTACIGPNNNLQS